MLKFSYFRYIVKGANPVNRFYVSADLLAVHSYIFNQVLLSTDFLLMQLINRDNIAIVDSFIRLYGEVVTELAPHFTHPIEFRLLDDSENEYRDIMARIGHSIDISPKEAGAIGLTEGEMLAAIAHEIGHIVYGTRSWMPDCEQRADAWSAQLGLGDQMISAIGKILDSRRYRRLTSLLVERIHFLQNLLRG